MSEKCKRQGCRHLARGDEYCSSKCLRLDLGLDEPLKMSRSEREKARDVRENGPEYTSLDDPRPVKGIRAKRGQTRGWIG